MAEEGKPGSFVHVEFAVKDPAKMKKFYGDVFGWKFQEIPEMNYALFETPGGQGGGVGTPQSGQHPGILNYILVPSVDEYLRKIQKAGAKVLSPKQEVPGMGWFATFEDPAGARMALWQRNPNSPP